MTEYARRHAGRLWLSVIGMIAVLAGCQGEDAVNDTEINIHTAPVEGAMVKVNGQDYGKTPLSVKGLLPGGVLVDVSLEGYKRAYDTYKVPTGGSATYTLTMERLVGDVSITSEPPNAMVFLDDGKPLGVTPLTGVKLAAGHHTLEVRHDKFESMTKTVDIRADYKYEIPFELAPRPSRIEVFSTPSASAIYLNGVLQNEKTPARIVVQPGSYTVSVYKGGYVMQEQVVEIGPASDATVSLVMKEGDVPPGMVLVPGGEFIMGTDDKSPDERPRRSVFIETFYIDKYEVTNAAYKKAITNYVYPKNQDEYPVTNVTWEQATEYARRVGKRLPTEAEWEKAARGTDGREYPWGPIWNPELANVNTGGLNPKAVPVGKFPAGASPFNCLDMAGNAYEWTSSWYSAYPGNNVIVKEYGQVFRVLRGGSFQTGQFEARCMTRRYDLMTNKRDDYGFRCAADVPKARPGKQNEP